MEYWTPGTKQRHLLSDGILWSVRPQTEKEINVLSRWTTLRLHTTLPGAITDKWWRVAASQETWTRRKQWKRSKWLGYISPVAKVFKSRTWYNSDQHYNKLDYYSTIREVCCHRSNRVDWLLPCYFLSCGFHFQHSRRSFPEFFATCVSFLMICRLFSRFFSAMTTSCHDCRLAWFAGAVLFIWSRSGSVINKLRHGSASFCRKQRHFAAYFAVFQLFIFSKNI